MEYVILANDTPSKLAQKWAGNAARWPEFCAANPKFPKHATYGCVFYAGNKAVLPDTWPGVIAAQQPVIPPPGPNVPPGVGPVPVGPAAAPAELAPTRSSAGILGIDTKTIVIGAGVVGLVVVAVYALKKKSQAA